MIGEVGDRSVGLTKDKEIIVEVSVGPLFGLGIVEYGLDHVTGKRTIFLDLDLFSSTHVRDGENGTSGDGPSFLVR